MQTEVGLPLPASTSAASQPCYANLATTSATTAKKKKPAASPPSAGAVHRDYENFR